MGKKRKYPEKLYPVKLITKSGKLFTTTHKSYEPWHKQIEKRVRHLEKGDKILQQLEKYEAYIRYLEGKYEKKILRLEKTVTEKTKEIEELKKRLRERQIQQKKQQIKDIREVIREDRSRLQQKIKEFDGGREKNRVGMDAVGDLGNQTHDSDPQFIFDQINGSISIAPKVLASLKNSPAFHKLFNKAFRNPQKRAEMWGRFFKEGKVPQSEYDRSWSFKKKK